MNKQELRKNELRFDNLFSENKGRFQRIAKSYANVNDWTDLMQEIWHQIWRALPNFNEASSISTWAYRVALNTAITYVRKDVKQPKSSECDEEVFETTEGSLEHTIHLMEDFIRSLPAIDKALFLMYMDGFSQQKISETLALSTSNVGVKVSRLKTQFEQTYLD